MKKRITALLLVILMSFSIMTVFASDRSFSQQKVLAQDLKALGLFKGVSDTEFELDRAPTRIEAVIMLIRVLGKEADATGKTWSHPFTDVPSWADNYVGYAYRKGLSNGTSKTTFGTEAASAEMYMTFMLRALGYSDKDGEDFYWDKPFTLARNINIYPFGLNIKDFLRADAVMISYAALNAYMKDNNITLAQKLINEGVFTEKTFAFTYSAQKIDIVGGQVERTAEQIYEMCAPAVFYIEVFDENGYATATGSGFFIDENGTAVTNYHVIKGASSAKATLAISGEVFEIAGVYDYSEQDDWAVIKINDTGFPNLIAGEMPVVGGSTVFAIGSPLGLQNTISQGLVSNPARELDGRLYIQTSAAISHGSSGGALINKYGEVIGITSAGFAEGENLNLAIPITIIEDYDNSTITPLSEIFGRKPVENNIAGADSTLSREEEAYVWLMAVIDTYGELREDGNVELTIDYDTDNGYIIWGLVQYEDCISADVYEVYDGSTYYCSVDFEPGEKPFLYYSYNFDQHHYFTAGEFFDASIIRRDETFVFSDFEGTAVKETNQNICGYYITDLLDFVNLIFDEYVSEYGNYSVADFGFINFE